MAFFVTFYSFKGGVGRTLALANVAWSLAHSGKKVVLIDLDLEAPSLLDFAEFKLGEGGRKRGFLDYAAHYADQGRCPPIHGYVHSCQESPGTGQLWVMPSGEALGESYAQTLAHLSWRRLHSYKGTRPMIEGLRQALSEDIQPDYVLIDSRTGFSDVGGLSTQLLADMIVLVFNVTRGCIEGSIRAYRSFVHESSRARERIQLVASPVPQVASARDSLVDQRIEQAMEHMPGLTRPIRIFYEASLVLAEELVVRNPESFVAAERYQNLQDLILRNNPDEKLGALQKHYDLETRRRFESLITDTEEEVRVLGEELRSLEVGAKEHRSNPFPRPHYPNEATRELARSLKQAYRSRAFQQADGKDTTDVDTTILNLRREIRQGGQLREGDFLLEGRLQLLEIIGRGGFAEVWKAYDESTLNVVAIKVLHGQHTRDESRRQRFFRGARYMAQLQHPGIVRVVEEKCTEGGFLFFVMEYVGGGDLRQAVKADRLSQEERLRITLEVGEALTFAHQRGVIHRDVKPGNVLLDMRNHAKLTDFDLVRAADTTGGTRTTGLGTFLYAAPETMMDAKTAAEPADVYGLGMTAVFALHGTDLPADVLWELPEFVAKLEVNEGCRKALQRAVARKVEDRWASVAEFCQALQEACR